MKIHELFVGQRVRIRDVHDLAYEFSPDHLYHNVEFRCDYGTYFSTLMVPLCGKEFVVSEIFDDAHDARVRFEDETDLYTPGIGNFDRRWWITPGMLEPVEESSNEESITMDELMSVLL